MNSWYAADRLAAGRRADLTLDAAGDVRFRAAQIPEASEQPLIPAPELAEALTLERVREPGAIGRVLGAVRSAWRTRGSAA